MIRCWNCCSAMRSSERVRRIHGDQLSDEEWNRIAEEMWYRTQGMILALKLPVTTAVGAVRVLAHVLRNEYLWGPELSADEQLVFHYSVEPIHHHQH